MTGNLDKDLEQCSEVKFHQSNRTIRNLESFPKNITLLVTNIGAKKKIGNNWTFSLSVSGNKNWRLQTVKSGWLSERQVQCQLNQIFKRTSGLPKLWCSSHFCTIALSSNWSEVTKAEHKLSVCLLILRRQWSLWLNWPSFWIISVKVSFVESSSRRDCCYMRFNVWPHQYWFFP